MAPATPPSARGSPCPVIFRSAPRAPGRFTGSSLGLIGSSLGVHWGAHRTCPRTLLPPFLFLM
eukprot:5773776-Pyramimonas_sp.AAC.1